jgi:hypothetical protein
MAMTLDFGARRDAVHGLQAPIVGREPELAAVSRFVRDVDQGRASLVLEGLAGIGKATIWTQSVPNAQAAGVLRSKVSMR